MNSRFRSLMACVAACWASAAAAQTIWLEGETFLSETPLRDLPGRERLPGEGRGFTVAGGGNREVISGGGLLHITLSAEDATRFLPDGGLVVYRDFDVPTSGVYEIWARIGYEWARSPFEWRLEEAPWEPIPPDRPTIDPQPIQTWNELGWLRLGERVRLEAGRHRIEFRHRAAEGPDGRPQRIHHMLDAVCITADPWRPCGKWAPGQDHRTERDREAAQHVFEANVQPGPDGRAWTELSGLWEYAPWGETDFPIPEDTRTRPVDRLPDLTTLRWFAYRAPGAREEQLPGQAFTHRYLLRTRVRIPPLSQPRGWFLDVQRCALIISVFVNGRYAGATDTFHTAWQMDLSPHLRAGEINEIVLAVKDPYYSLNPAGDPEAEGLGNRRYWNLPREFLQSNQGVAARHDYPVAADCRSGLLEPASLVMTGPAYAADVFVIPMEGRLGLEITLLNPTTSTVDLELANHVEPWNEGRGGPVELRFPDSRLRLSAGERRTLRMEHPWPNPRRWWPDDPFLYRVVTRVRTPLGEDLKRTWFGFRTIDWSTDQFRINGAPWQMWADLSAHGRDPREQVRIARERTNANQMRYWHNVGLGRMTRRQIRLF